jgi:eukaryotic-like serine/threonine-protein kinase
MAETGRALAGRYRRKRRIAAGGIADGWQACDLATGRPVAVWLLRAGCSSGAERFLAAATRAPQVRHRGIARVQDYGQSGPEGPLFLVTEPVAAAALSAVMQTGPLDPAWVLEVICQLASAVGAAHGAGLMHHDIEPGSLLLAPGAAVKLTGFGLAPGTGGPGGDLYALGLVAWACLSGAPPASSAEPDMASGYDGGPLPPLPATVPAGIAGLAADLTAADPAARPASAAEVVARCGDLMAAPMRIAGPRQPGGRHATLLLDPPAPRSPELWKIA